MALKDLFTKKEKEEKPINPSTLLGVRILAVGYLFYSLSQIIQSFIKGGEDAPSLWLLIVSVVVLGGGGVWIAIVTIKKLKELKAEEQARLDAEDEELARQAALEAAEATEETEADEAQEETEEEESEE